MIGCCYRGELKCGLSVIVYCCAVSVPILAAMPKTSRSTHTRGSRQAPYQPTTQNRGRATQARSMTRRGRSARGLARGGGVRRSVASQPPPVAVPPIAHSEAADSENSPLVDMDQLLSIIRAEVRSATGNPPPNSAPGAAWLFHYLVCMWYSCVGHCTFAKNLCVYVYVYIWVYVCIYVCISKRMGMKKKFF